MIASAASSYLSNKNKGSVHGSGIEMSQSPFESPYVQQLIPGFMRTWDTKTNTQTPFGNALQTGVNNIGQLLQNPGALRPDIAGAIAPRLSAESQNIAQNYRGIGQQQAGAAARSNLPVSLKAALQSALGMNQARDQAAARGQALTESEQLRRSDLAQTNDMLQAILNFISSARNSSAQTFGPIAQAQAQGSASRMALAGSLAGMKWPTYLGNQPGPG